jgi:hypothetical protein
MRIFRTLNRLVVTRNLWLIILCKILLFFTFDKHTLKFFKYSKDSKYVLIFCLAHAVIELLAIL